MILFELQRDPPSGLPCTLGVLKVSGLKFQTIERPWVPNTHGGKSGEKFQSCVAPGLYRLERFSRPSGERVFILSNPLLDVYQHDTDVPKGMEQSARTLVLVHTANYVEDVVGCIGPGLSRFYDGRRWMIQESKAAMKIIRDVVGNDLDIKLRIDA